MALQFTKSGYLIIRDNIVCNRSFYINSLTVSFLPKMYEVRGKPKFIACICVVSLFCATRDCPWVSFWITEGESRLKEAGVVPEASLDCSRDWFFSLPLKRKILEKYSFYCIIYFYIATFIITLIIIILSSSFIDPRDWSSSRPSLKTPSDFQQLPPSTSATDAPRSRWRCVHEAAK